MGFATKIRDNLLAIDKRSFRPLFEELKEANCKGKAKLSLVYSGTGIMGDIFEFGKLDSST
jgi:hypothetical protein